MVRKFETRGMRVSVLAKELVFLEKGFYFVVMADLEFFRLRVNHIYLTPEHWA